MYQSASTKNTFIVLEISCGLLIIHFLFVSFFFIFFISFVCAVYSHTTCLVHPSTSQMVSKTEHSLSVSFFFSERNLRLWYSNVFSVTWLMINLFFFSFQICYFNGIIMAVFCSCSIFEDFFFLCTGNVFIVQLATKCTRFAFLINMP